MVAVTFEQLMVENYGVFLLAAAQPEVVDAYGCR